MFHQTPSAIDKFIALFAMIIMGMSTAHAQNNDEEVRVRFLSFPIGAEPVETMLKGAGGQVIEIEAPSNEFSAPVKMIASSAWAVGETVTDDAGVISFKEYGRTLAPASPDQMLLLIRKGDKNEDGFDVVALDGRVRGFGGGKFLFMNAAKIDIAGVAGGEKFMVRPGNHTIIEPKAEEGRRTFHAEFFFRKDNEPRPFFSSKWPVSQAARALIFFYHDPESRHIRMHTIRDFM